MAVPNSSSDSLAMERTGNWVFSQDIPTDVVVEIGEANFSLHKFMLVAKSNYIRKLIMESEESDLTRIDLSDVPGGLEIFENAAKFCYGVNFEINVHNVAALRCAAEYLQMNDTYCNNNLASRTEEFISRVALNSLSRAVLVLKSCQQLLPCADELGIVKQCVEAVGSKACNEANFPSRSPPNWWTEELTILDVDFFGKVIAAMKNRGAKALTLASALITYTERALRELVRDHSGDGVKAANVADSNSLTEKRELLQSIVSLFPSEKAAFPINFLCCLLRCAIFLRASSSCIKELEKRISDILEHVTVDDLLVLSFTYDGERLLDLDSVRRIISGFVDKEKSTAVFNTGELKETSAATQRVAKTVDTYLGEIAAYTELTISKFNSIAVLIPKSARKVDDDLYRAVDIYLKAHPNLDEIEREKACSVMDPLKLSYEARVHASQNKRLPVQIVLHALYYDQLKLRSGAEDKEAHEAKNQQLQTDVTLVRENEQLRTELTKMKMYISDLQKNVQGGTSSGTGGLTTTKKPTFFSAMSKKLGKLNPFKHGSKDTLHLEDGPGPVDVTRPRRRRFSIS
ncbi:root phototropism protein 2 [Neltuma alba]|uniref:root phototropism protein 2 n=1 Tax=Neltuma alba TaxID=207710 RepID=UPI0010A2C656|nr:root phototropism protein 2 [Prosopis alba]